MDLTHLTPPSPGSWIIDATHHDRPMTHFVRDAMGDVYTVSFREVFERYGVLLETLEWGYIGGFVHQCVRPLGAPKDAKGPPPKFVFKLLCWLHPALRKRIRTAERVCDQKLWQSDIDRYAKEWLPEARRILDAVRRIEPERLDDEQLLEHLKHCRSAIRGTLYYHFKGLGCYTVPVGDFLAYAATVTDATTPELLQLLNGASPASLGLDSELQMLLQALKQSEDAIQLLQDEASNDVLDRLAEHPTVGPPLKDWLAIVWNKIFTGYDLFELTGREAPELIVRALRARLTDRSEERQRAVRERLRAIRNSVPEEERAHFNEVLADARRGYGLRDDRVENYAIGISKRALIEAGRRLVKTGSLHDKTDVVDLTYGEIVSLFGGARRPSADEVKQRVRYRETHSASDMPAFVGIPPSPPPPPEWLPPSAARIALAFGRYIDALNRLKIGEVEADEPSRVPGLSGHGASSGKYRGRARVVTGPNDFSKIEQGDVLVARLTSPHYNVLLPLLGGLVTDRGGLLSHPAIVAREFGIPCVVGTRHATTRIPDGAHVEVDGSAGVVTVLP